MGAAREEVDRDITMILLMREGMVAILRRSRTTPFPRIVFLMKFIPRASPRPVGSMTT